MNYYLKILLQYSGKDDDDAKEVLELLVEEYQERGQELPVPQNLIAC